MWWKSIAREPLVHFLVVGAALFALDRGRSAAPIAKPAPPVEARPVEAKTIRIDAEQRRALTATAEKRLGRPPAAEDIEAEIDRWISEEVLFREAIARGLDRDDPVVHERIASRMSYVLEQTLVVPEPAEAELRTWFDQHQAQWAMPERIDFTHVFVADRDETRVAQIEQALAAGAPAETLGDRFSGGHRYRGRKLADLAEAFGDEFVTGLEQQPAGTWQRRASKHGLHLVRVDRVSAAHDSDFAAARLDVRKSWLDEQRGRALAAEVKRLRDGWKIER
jgi:peptidyl-prolyl cis-trans isomerase C